MTSAPSAKLNALTLERNIPVLVTAELTRRCPLSCLHCYLPETRGRAPAGRELTTAQWKDILGQLADAGGLYLVFTGGEPLLRPDLAELCRCAKKLNFDVRIFSTGLGLTAELASGLKKAGVSAFEISFYGRQAKHDSVTGLNGSFKRSLAAARLLKKTGVKVKLKMPLMRINFGEAAWLKKLAKREGFEVSFDPVITPANDGNASALSLRLTGPQLAKAVKLLSSSPDSRSSIPDSRPPTPDPRPSTPRFPTPDSRSSILDFLCGAGRNVCAVDPAGNLYPCLQLPVKLGNLTRRRFTVIWKGGAWLKKWRKASVKDLKGCLDCPDIDLCSRCPGISLLEHGDILAPNAPACGLARALREV